MMQSGDGRADYHALKNTYFPAFFKIWPMSAFYHFFSATLSTSMQNPAQVYLSVLKIAVITTEVLCGTPHNSMQGWFFPANKAPRKVDMSVSLKKHTTIEAGSS